MYIICIIHKEMGFVEINFLYAAELKKKFDIYGSYYDLSLNYEVFPCRSELHIISKNIYLDDRKPDAVVCMMNPGSSRPLDISYIPKIIEPSEMKEEFKNKEVIPIQPDNAQYQIMRVMVEKDWKKVTVINLSDLRESKSKELPKLLKKMDEFDSGGHHSIWCENRREELERIIHSDEIPVILGWGQEKPLLKQAELALDYLKGKNMVGLAYDEMKIWYRFPSPLMQKAKLAWLSDILELLG